MELLDSKITTDISRDVSTVFVHWPVNKPIDTNLLGPSQVVTKWRPTANLALITNQEDLRILAGTMPGKYPANPNIRSFTVLFQYDNVLRLAISN